RRSRTPISRSTEHISHAALDGPHPPRRKIAAVDAWYAPAPAIWIPVSPRQIKEKQMKIRQFAAMFISAALPLVLLSAAASGQSEIKGAAILDHPCGKVAVKQMGLAHAGKIDDANKLTTKETQDQLKSMPAKDQT